METIKVITYQSPVGELLLGAFNGRLCLCDWVSELRRGKVDTRICRIFKASYLNMETEVTLEAIRQLDEYFLRERTGFNVPLLFSGTEFQHKVWSELMKIPYGTTISYRQLAHRIGNPKAVRAVARAVAANPISIFVPCHRVIGADHTLTGYAGGLDAKRMLLSIEAVSAAQHLLATEHM